MESNRIARLLQDTVGPSPWYWKTFALPAALKELGAVWYYDDSEGPGREFVSLRLSSDPDSILLCLGVHTRPIFLPGGCLCLWFPRDSTFTLVALVPADLRAFSRPHRFTKLGLPFYAGRAAYREYGIPKGQIDGTHAVTLPKWLEELDELILVGPYELANLEIVTTIISLLGRQQRMEVYPQRWFELQFGYGWEQIARVTRDPESGLMVGDGVRIGCFELAADSTSLRTPS